MSNTDINSALIFVTSILLSFSQLGCSEEPAKDGTVLRPGWTWERVEKEYPYATDGFMLPDEYFHTYYEIELLRNGVQYYYDTLALEELPQSFVSDSVINQVILSEIFRDQNNVLYKKVPIIFSKKEVAFFGARLPKPNTTEKEIVKRSQKSASLGRLRSPCFHDIGWGTI